MSTCIFSNTTASIAAWNLATFENLSAERIENQAEGLRLLDAELVTLVEVKNEDHIKTIAEHLSKGKVQYRYAFKAQDPTGNHTNHSAMHIGVIYKDGVDVSNVELMDGSDLGNPGYRKAFLCDVAINKFTFKLIGVHLKSGRDLDHQKIRDKQCKVIR